MPPGPWRLDIVVGFSSVPLLVRAADGGLHPERLGRPNVASGAECDGKGGSKSGKPDGGGGGGGGGGDPNEGNFFDGSMEADLPMNLVCEMFNVNHFIVSQVSGTPPCKCHARSCHCQRQPLHREPTSLVTCHVSYNGDFIVSQPTCSSQAICIHRYATASHLLSHHHTHPPPRALCRVCVRARVRTSQVNPHAAFLSQAALKRSEKSFAVTDLPLGFGRFGLGFVRLMTSQVYLQVTFGCVVACCRVPARGTAPQRRCVVCSHHLRDRDKRRRVGSRRVVSLWFPHFQKREDGQPTPTLSLLSPRSPPAGVLPPLSLPQAFETLAFLKGQLRSWFSGMVRLLVSRATVIPYVHSTFNVFMQTYEGRECDVTLMPWCDAASGLTWCVATAARGALALSPLSSRKDARSPPHPPRVSRRRDTPRSREVPLHHKRR